MIWTHEEKMDAGDGSSMQEQKEKAKNNIIPSAVSTFTEKSRRTKKSRNNSES